MKKSKGFAPFEDYSARLDEAIKQLFAEFTRQLPEVSEHADWALEYVKTYSLQSGKRTRGSLAAAAYDHAKGTLFSQVGLRLGAAIEMIQNHLLIIDDVVDRSNLRRGQSTLHRVYQRHYGSSEREADMAAILIGMLPGQMAQFGLATIDETPSQVAHALAILARNLTITDVAQIDDMHHNAVKKPNLAAVLRKHEQKSSYYSFVNPLTMGLVLAGVEPKKARHDAEQYGRPAGIAFQLQDDYLGLFGDTHETGKPVFDDMREGKYTLMIHYAFEAATDEERGEMEGILGDQAAGKTELERLQQIVRRTHADTKARQIARDYAAQAKLAAQKASSWSPKFGTILAELVDFSIERKA